MTLSQKKIIESVFAPGTRIVWLALAGFFLGSALCPFNPPNDHGSQSVKEGEIMNTSAESLTTIDNKHFLGPAPEKRQIETATFALG